MEVEYSFLSIGGLLEVTGLLTLLTNEESIAPFADLGLEIPVILGTADIQGFGLLILGSALTSYAIFRMKKLGL